MRLPLELCLPSPSTSTSSSTSLNAATSSITIDEESGELLLIELQGELEVVHEDGLKDDGDIRTGAKVGKLDLSVPVGQSLSHSRKVFAILNAFLFIIKYYLTP